MRAVLACAVLVACGAGRAAPDAGGADASADASAPAPIITATVVSVRTVTREQMLAAGEMQISGEPLAEAMGRDLRGYSRDLLPTDIYFDHANGLFWIDLAGYSTAVESYEYSKQPMNALAFELGAGTSLSHAPLVEGHLTADVQRFAAASNAAGKWVFAPGTFPTGNAFGDLNPTGTGTPDENPVGWPGIWPTAHVFASFDPTIDPSSAVALQCSVVSDDNPAEAAAPLISADYECDATTLHLRDRAAQIDASITPGADGFATWKYGLWTLNYLQVMHDGTNAAVASVASADLTGVGAPGNAIVGADADGNPTAPGTYLGSSDIEGFQAEMFLLEADARADDWLAHLSTADGATLGGFASVQAALAYDYATPLRWFPSKIAVVERAGADGFPIPSYAIASGDSDLLDQLGVAMGWAEVYALTDTRNADVGGSQPARAYFDGDPFAADDQQADGEPTLHDRALAMMRVALVDLDRMHLDPAAGVFVDHASRTTRGHTIATTSVAYTLVGLRTAARALGSQLELYSNNTPDTAAVSSPLDALPLHFESDSSLTFGGRLAQLERAHAALLYDHLTDASGRAYDGWDTAAKAPIDQADTLDAHTAAIRGLFAAYLSTGDVRYRDRAIAVWRRLDATFWDGDARIYTATPAPADTVEYTPMRFALLQSALRDVYELVATRPGGEALEPLLEDRFARVDKLVLNGWDDRNRDKHVDWPDECVRVDGSLPRGGLQLAERTLTGETGRLRDEGGGPGGPPTSDRDADCVPEIDDAHTAEGLADSVTFRITR